MNHAARKQRKKDGVSWVPKAHHVPRHSRIRGRHRGSRDAIEKAVFIGAFTVLSVVAAFLLLVAWGYPW